MTTDLDEAESVPPVPAEFPVSERDQLRNVILFGVNTGLMFLGSAVLNVGRVHAPVCKYLGASDLVCNLPSSAYLLMAASPLVVSCLFPQVSLLKRILVVCYTSVAAMTGLVAILLVSSAPNSVKIAAMILQGAVTGACLTTVTMFLFEMLSRGTEESKRGRALSLGYGRGPILGLLAALLLQLCLDGKSFGISLPAPIPYPWKFALPFAAAVPIMGLAGWLSTLFVIPVELNEPGRKPFISSMFGGVGDFVANRSLLLTFIIGVISFWCFSIGQNMTLYTKEVIGVPAETLVGYQLALRFGFKMAAGLCLGALLTRWGPRSTMLITAVCAMSGVAWAMVAPGYWFMLGFGLLGAGELFSVYLTNYILSCSSKARTRSNMGFASLTMLPAAPAGACLGAISDYFGQTDRAFGFRLSFGVALGFMVIALILTMLLPSHPERQPEPEIVDA